MFKFPNGIIDSPKLFAEKYLETLIEVSKKIDLEKIKKISDLLSKYYFSKNNVFVCGNGGSAAISNHFLCDHLKGVSTNTNLLPKIISLSANIEIISAVANDIEYADVFAFQLSRLAKPKDCLITISSSGNSKNIINAIKDNNVSTNSSTATATKSQFTSIPAGSYTIENDGGQWKFGTTNLNRVDYNGGSRFTSTTYAGLVIDTVETTPSSFKVYIGQNFSEKLSEFMATILETSSSVNAAKTAYTETVTDINVKLKELEKREELITTRYTAQFGSMEQAMSQFNSTKSLLENFMESWKKQK